MNGKYSFPPPIPLFSNVIVFASPWQSTTIYYSDVTISAMPSHITGVSIVCSTVCSCADQRKHQSSASPAFVRGIHWWPVDSPHKWPVTWKLFPFDDVILESYIFASFNNGALPVSLFGEATPDGISSQTKCVSLNFVLWKRCLVLQLFVGNRSISLRASCDTLPVLSSNWLQLISVTSRDLQGGYKHHDMTNVYDNWDSKYGSRIAYSSVTPALPVTIGTPARWRLTIMLRLSNPGR